MAFDFKGAEEGGLYQRSAFFISLALISTGIMGYSLKNPIYPSKAIQITGVLLFLFIIFSPLAPIIHGYNFQNYIIVGAPYLIMSGSFLFLALLCRRHGVGAVSKNFLPITLIASLTSCVWHVFYSATFFDGNLSDLRYRVVSPLLPFSLSILFATFYSGQRRLPSLIGLLILSSIIAISQTRSYLLTIATILPIIIYGFSKDKKAFTWKILTTFSILLSIIFLMYFIGGTASEVINLWTNRILGSSSDFGFDITTATRLAEYHNQITCLLSSHLKMVLGCGLGAPYDYSGPYSDFLIETLGAEGSIQGYWNGGHSLWIYTLYASGFVFGLGLNAIFIFCCLAAILVIYKSRKNPNTVKRTPIIASSALIAIFSTGFTAFPLGARSSAYFMGCLMAIVVAYYSKSRKDS